MLERLAGNDALKSELGAALRGGRLPHAVLLLSLIHISEPTRP